MKSPAGQETIWELRLLPNWPNAISVYVSVDTTAEPVIEAIEGAAAQNGLELRRVSETSED